MMAQLAETLMEAMAKPTDPAPSQLATLPDIITSTTSHISQKHPSHSSHPSKPHPRRHAQHTLHRFMKLDMDHLEQESRYELYDSMEVLCTVFPACSTSGSDSDNEDFRFKRKVHGIHCTVHGMYCMDVMCRNANNVTIGD